ncbi:cysteine desulfurase [Bacillus benzoevorans]|uniref:Cysteine desulfurase n=1 Tax=Bacillus benzoevorans TaxID=1456 RepID=A0A7X0HS50_9BACI|nr:IscS subfamily cysteine desulfurase [Bacillus benzoevorans]MBB6445890.1 cysteine desulfurase [Bacillus benzoevorans]
MKYFDYAATTPMDLEAAQIYVKTATEYYGNTGSLHDAGSIAKDILENCRRELAKMLGVDSSGIYFTSGGSESNYLGIQALLSSQKAKNKHHIISSLAEHTSIRSTLEILEERGYEVTLLPFNEEGQIDIAMLKEATKENTALIAIQHGNSEIGTLQPIAEIGEWCREKDILFHSDSVHTFGKIDLHSFANKVDSFSMSAHKFYGPKGIGVGYVNPKLAWMPHYPGTTHENGFRPGTLNVPAIAAMTIAAQQMTARQEEIYAHTAHLRQLFITALAEIKDRVTIYSAKGEQQLPHTLAMRIHGVEGQWAMLECNRRGYAISTGSACSTGLKAPAKTMTAMNVPDKPAKEMIRISFGRDTSEQDAAELAGILVQIAKESML